MHDDWAFIIRGYANGALLDQWAKAFSQFKLNTFEQRAIELMLDELDRLLRTRDVLDRLREAMPQGEGPFTLQQDPSPVERLGLFDSTKHFFDTFYSALSAVSGVVARYASVFHVNFGDNAKFVKWAAQHLEEFGDLSRGEIERARLFRALLNHPQQHPTFNWHTFGRPGYLAAHVVLAGINGRGVNPVPPGASRGSILRDEDWFFEAPDEVSVTNSLFQLAAAVLARVMVGLTARSAFVATVSLDGARSSLAPDYLDLSEKARSTPRLHSSLGQRDPG